MFQVVLINRVMEQRELELPVSGDEIQEAYDQLKVGNCETDLQAWFRRGKDPVWPDFQEVDVDNRILGHENKADKDICLWNGMWRVRLCNQGL